MTGRNHGASRLAVIFIAATGLFPHAARADAQRPDAKDQQKAAPAKTTGAAAFDPVRERALEVVGLEINRAKRYSQPRNSVRVWTAAAEALWDYDAETARKTLRDAFALLGRAEAPPRDGEKESTRLVRTDALQRELRTDILSLAQRRDPALARELIESVKDDAGSVASAKSEPLRFGSASLRKAGLAQLAARLAEQDPAAALDYATQSLGQGVPSELQTVFRFLLKSNPAAARELFRRAVESLEADPSANHFDVLFVAFYVQTAPADAVNSAIAARLFTVAHERVLRVWQRAVDSGRPDSGLVSSLTMTINTLVPLARRYSAETGDKLWNLGRQVAQDSSGRDKKADELYQSGGGGALLDRNDADSVLARAERETNEEERDALYFLAAITLWQQGEIDRALSAAGRARPTEKRDSVTDLIRSSQARDLVTKGELADALKVMERIGDVEARADVTVAFATAARRKGQAELAKGAILEMQKLLDKEKGSARHARTSLWLASAYAQLDPAAGFELMGAAVKLSNTVRAFEETKPEQRHVILGGYVREAFLVGDAKADFRTGFRTLARQDLQRTIELAEGFESEIFRGLALVSAADAALKKSQDAGKKATAADAPKP